MKIQQREWSTPPRYTFKRTPVFKTGAINQLCHLFISGTTGLEPVSCSPCFVGITTALPIEPYSSSNVLAIIYCQLPKLLRSLICFHKKELKFQRPFSSFCDNPFRLFFQINISLQKLPFLLPCLSPSLYHRPKKLQDHHQLFRLFVGNSNSYQCPHLPSMP